MPNMPTTLLSGRLWCGVHRHAVLLLATVLLSVPIGAAAAPATVRHAGKTVRIDRTLDDPTDLWVQPADMTRVNGFVLKPEGACLADICIPIRHDRDSDLLVTRTGESWINLSAFARKIGQKLAVDYDKRLWTFGPLPFKTSNGASAATPQRGTP